MGLFTRYKNHDCEHCLMSRRAEHTVNDKTYELECVLPIDEGLYNIAFVHTDDSCPLFRRRFLSKHD